MKTESKCLATVVTSILAFVLVAAIGSNLVHGKVKNFSVRAAGPDNFTVPVDEIFSFDDCGFTIEGHVTGFIRFHDFFDRDGNFVREISNFSLKVIYINPANGETLKTLSAGPNNITFHEDGSSTFASIGVISRIVVPGEGLVAAAIGKVVVFFADPADTEPEVIFLAGKFEGDIALALCAALG